MTTNTEQLLRDATAANVLFEAWATKQGYDLTREDGALMATYRSGNTEHAWRGYCHHELTQPAPVGEPDAYLHDDGFWTAAKTDAGRQLNDRLLFAGSPKIGVHTTPPASQEQAQQPSEPNCDRSACGDFSPGPCDHPDCHALRKQQPSGDNLHCKSVQKRLAVQQPSGGEVADAPERIWLQINADGSPEDTGYPSDHEGVTWCWHSIGGQEVEYVRADLAKPQSSGGEVVQWQKRHPMVDDGQWSNTSEPDAKWWRDNCHGWGVRALTLAAKPEPMTDDQVWHSDGIMSANGIAGFKLDALMRIVRAVEAHHGITAQAKGGE